MIRKSISHIPKYAKHSTEGAAKINRQEVFLLYLYIGKTLTLHPFFSIILSSFIVTIIRLEHLSSPAHSMMLSTSRLSVLSEERSFPCYFSKGL